MLPLPFVVAAALIGAGDADNTVLEFTWERKCKPCQMMSPIVSRLQRDDYPIRKIDIDEDRETPRQYGIERYPTFVLVVEGHEVDRITGMVSEDKLKQFCARVPTAPAASRSVKAEFVGSKADLGAARDFPDRSAKQDKAGKPGLLGGLFGSKSRDENPAAEPPPIHRGQTPDRKLVPADARLGEKADPLAATVRIRIRDKKGDNFGTGTVIDSRPGRTLILTCGHIFRGWTDDHQIQVDVFSGGAKAETIIGSRVVHDLEDDVALIRITTEEPLPVCRVAPPATKILTGLPVVSVGCNGGDDPTVQSQKITAVNRYLGAENIECGVVPARGRSGGGLFDRAGRVIGVCWSANPKDNEGLYAGLKTIHKLLDSQRLGGLYRDSGSDEELVEVDGSAEELEPLQIGGADAAPEEIDTDPAAPANSPRELKSQMSAGAPPVAPQISRDDVVGSEVFIIIQSRGDSENRSKLVRLHRASREFWEYLAPELETEDSMLETTLRSERPAAAKAQVRRARRPATSQPGSGTAEQAAANDDPDAPQIYRRKRS